MSTYEFPLPDTGEGLHEAEILAWFVKIGDFVKENDPLVEIQTDKAVVEITSPVAGKIASLGAEQGETLKVGEILVYLTDVETKSKQKEQTEQRNELKQPIEKEQQQSNQDAHDKRETKKRVKAAPSVRKAAREAGVDLGDVTATGPNGRILRSDLENYLTKKDSDARVEIARGLDVTTESREDEVVPIRGLRKIIFENMKRASSNAVLCTGMDDVEVSRLVEVRKSLMSFAEEMNVKLTYLPFVVKAVSHALKKHPVFNSLINEEKMTLTYRKDIHIGIAMATEEGLVVPVIHHADKKTIMQIAVEINELAEKAREQKLSTNELTGSTFTITSTGAKGGWYATPIINYPEVAILGVHKIKKQPIVVEDEIKIGHMMGMSITFDHRVIDGEPAGNFMTEVAQILHAPEVLMLDLR